MFIHLFCTFHVYLFFTFHITWYFLSTVYCNLKSSSDKKRSWTRDSTTSPNLNSRKSAGSRDDVTVGGYLKLLPWWILQNWLIMISLSFGDEIYRRLWCSRGRWAASEEILGRKQINFGPKIYIIRLLTWNQWSPACKE